MNYPFNELSDAEAERLALLLEELGEVQQAIGKILRHGYESRNPDVIDPGSNRTTLSREIGHVLACVDILIEAEDIKSKPMHDAKIQKREKVKKYFHHQPQP